MTDDYPIIRLPGDDQWVAGDDSGQKLDELFPGQDAWDFAIGCSYNDWGPLKDEGIGIASLVMIAQGENDGAEWEWEVKTSDGRSWHVQGGCDYTGWDCQSGLTWTET